MGTAVTGISGYRLARFWAMQRAGASNATRSVGQIKSIEASEPRFAWFWEFEGKTGEVQANTKGEARAMVKHILGIKPSGRLPPGVWFGKRGPVLQSAE